MQDSWVLFFLFQAVKVLVFPAYHSTDFEVHRNWLAITHSLPPKEWYFEETSQWTLDYPPFFAWFEFLLSFPASWIDSGIVTVENLDYASAAAVVYQRGTVVAMDLLLFLAILHLAQSIQLTREDRMTSRMFPREVSYSETAVVLTTLVFFNPALFIVDHIHFQYNGFLFGVMLFSISHIVRKNYLVGGILFAVLLNLKHLFLCASPVYFVYLLRRYVLGCERDSEKNIYRNSGTVWSQVGRFLLLGGCVIAVFLLSFGPFLVWKQIHQVFSRMFPFGRGLVHAYWAPNLWALYNTADKVLYGTMKVLKLFPADTLESPTASFTGGLVGAGSTHTVLPSVTPILSILITLLSLVPTLGLLWRRPNATNFVLAIVVSALSFFIYGWHVHEKAILTATMPLGLLALVDGRFASIYLFLALVGHYSVFPLLHQSNETPIKLVAFLFHGAMSFVVLNFWFRVRSADGSGRRSPGFATDIPVVMFSTIERLYLIGLIGVHVMSTCVFPWALGDSYPFAPLMLVSVYCSIGVIYSWICLQFTYN